MSVDYNKFAKTFSQSRKNMYWPELEYFFTRIASSASILDIGCGNGRFLEQYYAFFGTYPREYMGIDLSENLVQEAKKQYPHMHFLTHDMREIQKLGEGKSFDVLFCIASFHHLESLDEREQFLQDLHTLSHGGTKVYMTNWHLLSAKNQEKYKNSKIPHSENRFGSWDFQIKIGEYQRYYHSFSLREIEYLAKAAGWNIEENRVFSGEKNSITILTKGL